MVHETLVTVAVFPSATLTKSTSCVPQALLIRQALLAYLLTHLSLKEEAAAVDSLGSLPTVPGHAFYTEKPCQVESLSIHIDGTGIKSQLRFGQGP